MPLRQRIIAPGAVDPTASLHGRARGNFVGPAAHVGVALHVEELGRLVHLVVQQRAIPGPDCHVGDAVFVAGDVAVLGQLAVEHVELALDLHRVAVDRVLVLLRRVGVEVAEAAAEEGRAAHLPEQPVQRLGALGQVPGQEVAEFFREVHQDRARFEDAQLRLDAGVQQGRDLRVRVDPDEAAAELVAVADPDRPGVVLGVGHPQLQQFLEQDGDLHAVGRGQRIQLERVLAARQLLVMGRAGDGPVDAGEGAAVALVPGPDAGGNVGFVRHLDYSLPG